MRLDEYLQQHGVAYEKHTHPLTYTSQGLADAEHVSGRFVAKPVIVRGDHGFVMCVVPAPQHVELSRVAEVLRDDHVRLATEQEMTGLFPECELGAEPPIGALFGLTTVMDQQLEDDEYLVMQAGTHTDAVRLRRADYERVAEPIVAPISC